MSGVEIVAGVAAIVSAFNGSVTLYRSWRGRRRERLENEQNKNLERSLTIGGTTVQREYDGHFARLGQQFAVGDGKTIFARPYWEWRGSFVIYVRHFAVKYTSDRFEQTGREPS
jgi:hypothetical protein